MKIAIDITKYIDKKNEVLYKSLLERHYKFSLFKVEEKPTDFWECSLQGDNVTINYKTECASTASLTHELLHVDLVSRGFTDNTLITSCLTNVNNIYLTLFSNSSPEGLYVAGHINNIMAHAKFYNTFISMGYNPNEFVHDFEIESNIDGEISEINNCTNAVCYTQKQITSYFTAVGNFNPEKESDYTILLNYLKCKESALFDILDSHWRNWRLSDSIDNCYFLKSLFNEVQTWYNENRDRISNYFS